MHLWAFGVGEDFVGWPLFDDHAEVQEDDVVGDALRLPQGMGDEDDGEVFLEFEEEFFDLFGGEGVEGGGGFVAEDDLGLDRDSSGEAEALLLADGESGGGVVEPVFDFVP